MKKVKEKKTISIDKNKYEFIELLKTVDRQGADIPALIYKLESSDFFIAPASTKYHLSIRGGLCEHSLNVYRELKKLNDDLNLGIPDDTVIIISLLHDLDKMDKYELYSKNVQHYHPYGKRSDENGKFDWVKEWQYKIRDAENRFIFGHHGQNSEYIANSYIPLTTEESAAIANHHINTTDEFKIFDTSVLLDKYTTLSALHMADFTAAYLIENRYEYINE